MTVAADKLKKMAEQIAANITVSKDPEIIASALADHLQRFWDPRMREEFVKMDRSELSPILQSAAKKLSTDAA